MRYIIFKSDFYQPVAFIYSTNISFFIIFQQTMSMSTTSVNILAALYIFIAVVGGLGNSVTLAILLRADSRKKISFVLLFNVVFCDLLVCIFCIPFDVVTLFLEEWVLGSAMCVILTPFQTALVFVSSWTFVLMLFERRMALSSNSRDHWPTKWRKRVKWYLLGKGSSMLYVIAVNVRFYSKIFGLLLWQG